MCSFESGQAAENFRTQHWMLKLGNMLIRFIQQSDKLLFVGMPPWAMRARCGDIRYCPAPLGIVTLRKSLFDAPAKASPVQGEVARRSRDGGVVADQSYHYVGIYANSKLFPHNPSVKNQRFLTAPFTQGSLGAPAPVRQETICKR